MKKWTKLTALMLTAAMVMTGCGGSEAPADDAASGEAYTVGIIQLLEHGSLDQATQGFMDKLTELLGEENVVFDHQNAQGEQANCTTIATKFASNGVDLIMANATLAVQTAAAATADIPIVGTSVTDYETAGVVASKEAPGANVTGVSDLASVEAQVDVLMQFCDPENTKVAIVYCSAEPNSIFQRDLAVAYLDQLGVPYAEYTVADSNEIQSVVTNAVSECNAMFVLADNTLANNMEIVKNITVPAGIPVVAGSEDQCAVGGLGTIAINYYDLGEKAAEMAYEILVNGADPAEMPIQYMTDGIIPKYNPEIADALGVTIPEGMEPIA